jgi:hypothetical protein
VRVSIVSLDAGALRAAADAWVACQQALALAGRSVLDAVLDGAGLDRIWSHHPPGDVYDPVSHAQYYFHAHPPDDNHAGEVGHFHTFLRPFGVMTDISPAPLADYVAPANKRDLISHLVAIAVDSSGRPVRLFTTNRWVTGEIWYAAGDVRRMVRHFRVDNARPQRASDAWLTALLQLFRPEIDALIEARDAALAQAVQPLDGTSVYEDRRLEELASCSIDIDARLKSALR